MSAQAASPSPAAGDGSGDPSMEDILASIRRILSEDEGQSAQAAPAPTGPQVLELDASMLVEEEAEVASTPPPMPGPEQLPSLHADRSTEPPSAPPPAATADRIDMLDPAPDSPPLAPHQSLVAPEAAAAAASSVGSLLRSIGTRQTVAVRGGGPTIEDLVRDELRPALKAWLDANLPPLVERLVRAEIERVVGRVDL